MSLARDRKYIIVVAILLSPGIYKNGKRKMKTGQRYGLGIGGCKRLCPVANGA